MADFCYAEGCREPAAPGWKCRIAGSNSAVLLCEAHMQRVRDGAKTTLIPPAPDSITFTAVPGQIIVDQHGYKVRFEEG